jgi:hypothetical protein
MRSRIGWFLLILLFLFFTPYAKCQVSEKETSQLLEELFDRLVDNHNDSLRIRINDSIILNLDGYIKSDTVFNHRFTNLRHLGQITSPDSLLKIITWNLILENEPSRYYCYFIRKQSTGKGNKIFRLSAGYNKNQIRSDSTYTESNWYGALYYEIRPDKIGNQDCWIILGIDYGNPDITRKIIDVISFTNDGSILFGQKCFSSGEDLKFRVVFEYSSSATMSLRFRTDNSIVFDHLVSFSQNSRDDRQYYAPDYSFDAYNFENGLWKLKINVDVRNKE